MGYRIALECKRHGRIEMGRCLGKRQSCGRGFGRVSSLRMSWAFQGLDLTDLLKDQISAKFDKKF
jgi:hypothetical protein